MPALLTRDGEKQVDGSPPVIGKIDCPKRDCATSYILRSNEKLIMYVNEKSVEVMKRWAVATLEGAHPVHTTGTYYWHGFGIGWRKADTKDQGNEL